MVHTGLEKFIKTPPKWVLGKRLGLLCNPASVNRQLTHTRDLINSHFPGQLKALYSPQHGFFAEKQDNMVESEDLTDPILQIPVFSLYGHRRIPNQEMLDLIDILIIDLQDAGTRVYTFIYTMSYCLEAAKCFNKQVIVLDRPNPLNGLAVEGNCLSTDYTSFVGRYPIPMRHGLTIGELALLFNDHFSIGCDLEIIQMENWSRSMYFTNTDLPWIPPSPNLPTPVSAMVYPGQVLWEGTNISEGRGTTQPFELFGAPFINIEKVLSTLRGNKVPGGMLRQTVFEPTSNKWKNQPCIGFQIHVTDPDTYRPYITSLKLLQAVMACHTDRFEFTNPPYEYEYSKLPIDLILGDREIRHRIEQFENIDGIEKSWKNKLDEFIKISKKFHLYK
ncbi:MAG: DUF1343 domain-containing protein [Deltaproteobacteria bacterium]|nr:DUF1343 domain-containing protein [Deltaproteobacteria bacterium]MBT8373375.1 DUF1343 domain-containing protein [Deltaproteobacteria bacterium]